MSKNLLYLITLLILAGLAFWATKTGKNLQTTSKSETAFAFKDTAAIQQIRITDRDTRKVLLQKQPNGSWVVNEKQYPARKDGIAQLLKAIGKLQVLSPAAYAAQPKIMESLKNPSKTVEIFTDNLQQPAHKFYIGPSGPEGNGNYALIEGRQRPYIITIPAFEGQIIPIFFTQEMTWRDRTIFNYTANQITAVKIDYTQAPAHSFEIKNNGNNQYSIAPLNETYKVETPSNTQKIEEYLNLFVNRQAEAFMNDYPNLDSLEKATPYCRLTLTTKDGNSNQIVIFTAPVTPRTKLQSSADGKPMKYDIDRYFAFINQGHDLTIIQTFIFGPLFKKYTDFFANSPTPK